MNRTNIAVGAFAICVYAALELHAIAVPCETGVVLRSPRHFDFEGTTQEKLPQGAVARLGAFTFRQPFGTTTVAWSTDGASIIAGSERGGPICLWDAATGRMTKILVADARTSAIANSPDGKKIALCTWDGCIVYDLDRKNPGELVHKTATYAISWSRDALALAAGGWKKIQVLLFDQSNDKLKFTRDIHYGHFVCVAMSPDGTLLAISGRPFYSDTKNGIHLWNAFSGKEVGLLQGHERGIDSLAFSPDGTLLLSAGRDKTVRVWDVAKQCQLESIPTQNDGVDMHSGIATFSPDGKSFAICGESTPVQLWDAATRKKKWEITDCGGDVTALAFSPDSKRLVTGGRSAALRIWDVAASKELTTQQGHFSGVVDLAFSPDGKLLASRGGDRTVRLWDWRGSREVHQFSLGGTGKFFGLGPHHVPRSLLAFSPDGTLLAAAGPANPEGEFTPDATNVYVFNVSDCKEQAVFKEKQFQPRGLAFSQDGLLLASASRDGLRFWQVPSGKEHAVFALREKPNQLGDGDNWSVAFAPDGTLVASGTDTGRVRLWNLTTKTQMDTIFTDRAKVGQVAFSPTGVLLACCEEGQTPKYTNLDEARRRSCVNLYDVATCMKVATVVPPDPQAPVTPWTHGSMAFSPDGRLLATSGDDAIIHVWDVLTLQEVAKFAGHNGPVLSLAFSPDSKVLVSGSMDSTILIWNVSGGAKLPAPVDLSATELDDLWTDLKYGKEGYRAMLRLVMGRKQAVDFLRITLLRVAEIDSKQVAKLLADLDADKSPVREQATRALEKLGSLVEPAIKQKMTEKVSPEAQQRMEGLLKKIKSTPTGPHDWRQARAVFVLEYVGSPEARQVLAGLAKGAAGAPLTRAAKNALHRLDARLTPAPGT